MSRILSALASWMFLAGVVSSPAAEAKPLDQAPIVAWSEPRIVWETTGHTSNPQLVTDAWGKVHLFFLSQGEGEAENTLFHVDADNADASPVDVLIGISEYRVTADPLGRLYVIAHGRNNTILFSSVDGIDASRAGAWSASQTLGEATLGIDISADADGGLHLCYPNNHAAFYQQSVDGGRTWSDPTTIADMSDPAGVATYVRCAADTMGAVHAAWAEARPPNYYPPEGVFYSRSTDSGQNWEATETIAGQHYSLPSLMADPAGSVHLVWQGDVSVGGRYYRQRPAGKEGAWNATETVVPAGRGGMSGEAFLAYDSVNTLHLGVDIDGIYWVTRRSTWTTPLELSGSLRGLPNTSGSIEQGTLAIANGNELYVAFEFDFRQIYLLSGQSNAPTLIRTPQVDTNRSTPPVPETTAARPTLPPGLSGADSEPTPTLTPWVSNLGGETSGLSDTRQNFAASIGAGLALIVVTWAIWNRQQGVRSRRRHRPKSSDNDGSQQ